MQSAQGVTIRRSTRPTRMPRRYSPYGSRTTVSVQPAPVQAAPPTPPRASIFMVYDFPYVVGQIQSLQDAPGSLPSVKIEVEDAPKVHALSPAPPQSLPVKQEMEDAPEVTSAPAPEVIKTEIEVQAPEYTPAQLRALEVKQEIEDAPEVIIKLEEPEPVPIRLVKMEIQEEAPTPMATTPVKTEPAAQEVRIHQESESVQEFLQRIYSEVQQIDAQYKQRIEEHYQRRRAAIDALFFTHN